MEKQVDPPALIARGPIESGNSAQRMSGAAQLGNAASACQMRSGTCTECNGGWASKPASGGQICYLPGPCQRAAPMAK